jgi:hypothetical protein
MAVAKPWETGSSAPSTGAPDWSQQIPTSMTAQIGNGGSYERAGGNWAATVPNYPAYNPQPDPWDALTASYQAWGMGHGPATPGDAAYVKSITQPAGATPTNTATTSSTNTTTQQPQQPQQPVSQAPAVPDIYAGSAWGGGTPPIGTHAHWGDPGVTPANGWYGVGAGNDAFYNPNQPDILMARGGPVRRRIGYAAGGRVFNENAGLQRYDTPRRSPYGLNVSGENMGLQRYDTPRGNPYGLNVSGENTALRRYDTGGWGRGDQVPGRPMWGRGDQVPGRPMYGRGMARGGPVRRTGYKEGGGVESKPIDPEWMKNFYNFINRFRRGSAQQPLANQKNLPRPFYDEVQPIQKPIEGEGGTLDLKPPSKPGFSYGDIYPGGIVTDRLAPRGEVYRGELETFRDSNLSKIEPPPPIGYVPDQDVRSYDRAYKGIDTMGRPGFQRNMELPPGADIDRMIQDRRNLPDEGVVEKAPLHGLERSDPYEHHPPEEEPGVEAFEEGGPVEDDTDTVALDPVDVNTTAPEDVPVPRPRPQRSLREDAGVPDIGRQRYGDRSRVKPASLREERQATGGALRGAAQSVDPEAFHAAQQEWPMSNRIQDRRRRRKTGYAKGGPVAKPAREEDTVYQGTGGTDSPYADDTVYGGTGGPDSPYEDDTIKADTSNFKLGSPLLRSVLLAVEDAKGNNPFTDDSTESYQEGGPVEDEDEVEPVPLPRPRPAEAPAAEEVEPPAREPELIAPPKQKSALEEVLDYTRRKMGLDQPGGQERPGFQERRMAANAPRPAPEPEELPSGPLAPRGGQLGQDEGVVSRQPLTGYNAAPAGAPSERATARTMAPAVMEADNPPVAITPREDQFAQKRPVPPLRSVAEPPEEPPTAESGLIPLASAAASKAFRESRGPNWEAPGEGNEQLTGYAQQGLRTAGQTAGQAVTEAYGGFKQRLADYVNGKRNMPPEQVQQLLKDAAAANPNGDHNSDVKHIFDNYLATGMMDNAARFLESMKVPHDRAHAIAAAALEAGSLENAAKFAERAHALIPDGRVLRVLPNKDGTVTMVVQRGDIPDAPAQSFTLTANQFYRYLTGQAGNFDHTAQNTLEKNLDILVNKDRDEPPVTGTDAGATPAPTAAPVASTGYNAPISGPDDLPLAQAATGYNTPTGAVPPDQVDPWILDKLMPSRAQEAVRGLPNLQDVAAGATSATPATPATPATAAPVPLPPPRPAGAPTARTAPARTGYAGQDDIPGLNPTKYAPEMIPPAEQRSPNERFAMRQPPAAPAARPVTGQPQPATPAARPATTGQRPDLSSMEKSASEELPGGYAEPQTGGPQRETGGQRESPLEQASREARAAGYQPGTPAYNNVVRSREGHISAERRAAEARQSREGIAGANRQSREGIVEKQEERRRFEAERRNERWEKAFKGKTEKEIREDGNRYLRDQEKAEFSVILKKLGTLPPTPLTTKEQGILDRLADYVNEYGSGQTTPAPPRPAAPATPPATTAPKGGPPRVTWPDGTELGYNPATGQWEILSKRK